MTSRLTDEESTAYCTARGHLRGLIEKLKVHLSGAAGDTLPVVDAAQVQADLQEFAQHACSEEGFREIEPYLHASPVHYTRNLVFSCDDFEVMVICWGTSHGSRVHNHASSHCWLSVVNSTVCEQRFVPAVISATNQLQLTMTSEAASPAPTDGQAAPPLLVLVSESTLEAGQVSYINDTQALHRVAAFHTSSTTGGEPKPSLSPHGAVTLHVYSPPIRRVKIFEPSRTYVRTPGFFSINGKKT